MSYNDDVTDGLTGTLLAFEGLTDSVTVFNSPTGCKYHPAELSDAFNPERSRYDPYLYGKEFYFSQPRIPCTYLGSRDLVHGVDEKLGRLIQQVGTENVNIVGVVNSPGASLIGCDLKQYQLENAKVISVESPGFSESFEKGFQRTIISILNEMSPPSASPDSMSVNLIGTSMTQLGWKDSHEDLKHLLGLCGISVKATIGAGWNTNDIRNSASAAANLMLSDELGNEVADWYTRKYGMPLINSGNGVPLGFSNVEEMINSVCKELGADPSSALSLIHSSRSKAAHEIQRMNIRSSGLPRGCTFSILGSSSLVYSTIRFLYSYLGMIPVAVSTTDRTYDAQISEFLKVNSVSVSDDPFHSEVDIVIGNGKFTASVLQRGLANGSAEIESPPNIEVSVYRRPMLGLGGTMYFLDSVLNSL